MRGWSLVTVCLGLLGCAAHPVHPEWERLSPADRTAAALDTVRTVLEREQARGLGGSTRPDRQVVDLDPLQVGYRLRAGEGGARLGSFRFKDVADVTFREDPGLPGRLGAIRIYFASGSPSGRSSGGRQPLLETDYLLLRSRSFSQFRGLSAAVQYLKGLPQGGS